MHTAERLLFSLSFTSRSKIIVLLKATVRGKNTVSETGMNSTMRNLHF